jgi:hypothetical protein
MKLISRMTLLFIVVSILSGTAHSQQGGVLNSDTYCKANVGLSNFKLLGVSPSQYAKCLEAKNYLEEAKKVKMVTIDGVDFVDNGENYDLVANDGILTSKSLFKYEGTGTAIGVGQYKNTKDNQLVYDISFAHLSKIQSGGLSGKLSVACNFAWVNCNSWPQAYQSICNSITWPFSGYLSITNCRITWTS